MSSPATLPNDQRYHLGGILFLVSLVVFFISSILLYAIYAYARRDDPRLLAAELPASFLYSTFCLMAISVLVHLATKNVRRERRILTTKLLSASAIAAVVFTTIQFFAMYDLLYSNAIPDGSAAKGLAKMVVVLAFLHALHVIGGVVALVLVAVGSYLGRYDHERHWPVDFAAQYWHFLDVVWVCMLLAFWLTTGGF